jgi:phosphate transport system protein
MTMTDHTIRAFDTDLRELTAKIVEMGGLVDRQIRDAVEALMKQDTALAKRVTGSREQVDGLQHEIEERAIVTIARRQPMAIDLRELVGALRIANDLERIGDYAENIAKEVQQVTVEPVDETMLQLKRMVELALVQLARVVRSYERRDVAEALEVWRADVDLDALDNSLFRELITYMLEDPGNLAFCMHLMLCAKNIERVGDHATNIAETVYYIVEGRPLLEERPKLDLTIRETLPSPAQ